MKPKRKIQFYHNEVEINRDSLGGGNNECMSINIQKATDNS